MVFSYSNQKVSAFSSWAQRHCHDDITTFVLDWPATEGLKQPSNLFARQYDEGLQIGNYIIC